MDRVGPGPADRVWLPLGAHHGTGRLDLGDLAYRWPATPGATVADDAERDSADTETQDGVLPAPSPLPPDLSLGTMASPRR